MPGMGVRVREATADDVGAMNDIHGHYALTTAISFDLGRWRDEDRLEWLARHPAHGPHRCVVAVDDTDAVVGWASTSVFNAKVCYAPSVECSVFVRDGFGGKGIGTSMYATLFELVAGEGLHRMYAGITLPNDASVALHERFGFTQLAVLSEVGRKFDRWHDVAWYERRLDL
jgi:phosphinothricin acetyltransferase